MLKFHLKSQRFRLRILRPMYRQFPQRPGSQPLPHQSPGSSDLHPQPILPPLQLRHHLHCLRYPLLRPLPFRLRFPLQFLPRWFLPQPLPQLPQLQQQPLQRPLPPAPRLAHQPQPPLLLRHSRQGAEARSAMPAEPEPWVQL